MKIFMGIKLREFTKVKVFFKIMFLGSAMTTKTFNHVTRIMRITEIKVKFVNKIKIDPINNNFSFC